MALSGADLQAARKAAGLSQSGLAAKAGVSRDAVSYWERKERLNSRGWAVTRMASVLSLDLKVKATSNARAGGWGVSRMAAMLEAEEARRLVKLEDWKRRHDEREARRQARRRVACGAKTRKATACRNMSEPGKARCKFHGGMSTGARTPEGIGRIVEAQRRRWSRHHAQMEAVK
ncbi:MULTISPECIES: helix-turn-helix domain-containing protein [unclassified Rhizobium]|uniref:helix-turn-helix domain-containing protein n=1 Tax=unclassified Rhizobium TaxID=2613769 RepID=UPI001ADAEB1A|nr:MULTISPECIES: helix-turn-helix transcriptional regulator [unclassified Rhizobium]MBO9100336.1 helix-turn-helix transcriptional regulator [Rhizobium sp. L58/93]MBO9186229.1 helix-turn-helix transcriptional regulator [Rhizobium sp. E27B/91]QXZ83147.1 helix-turn-helix transcriptional regulator [Rhizobium sp. K1/93]QXZ89341.1 helix-turn-helix transcriptional regulator [Rhizobium sp. K15/93]QYA01929.1 helix-turn-helix transcriptional regulator [Rhizobium sp. B21/90]